ncbi:MAG: dihydropteroate synthase [Bacteroidota bacterium]
MNEPKVMGILNITKDSFYDGGKHLDQKSWTAKAEKLVEEGASIIDIGAVSSKPGSLLTESASEWEVLKKPIDFLVKKYPEIIFSVDTYNALTAQKAADLGVDMINDISGGSIDKSMIKLVSQNNLAFVLMHLHGIPENMQVSPMSGDIIAKVKNFFSMQLSELESEGCKNILLDPGFGFGKTLDQNYLLLKEMNVFQQFNYGILVGLSRKSMIFKHLEINPEKALNGTSVLNTFALQNGAKVLRVHDVREANEVIKLFTKYQQT